LGTGEHRQDPPATGAIPRWKQNATRHCVEGSSAEGRQQHAGAPRLGFPNRGGPGFVGPAANSGFRRGRVGIEAFPGTGSPGGGRAGPTHTHPQAARICCSYHTLSFFCGQTGACLPGFFCRFPGEKNGSGTFNPNLLLGPRVPVGGFFFSDSARAGEVGGCSGPPSPHVGIFPGLGGAFVLAAVRFPAPKKAAGFFPGGGGNPPPTQGGCPTCLKRGAWGGPALGGSTDFSNPGGGRGTPLPPAVFFFTQHRAVLGDQRGRGGHRGFILGAAVPICSGGNQPGAHGDTFWWGVNSRGPLGPRARGGGPDFGAAGFPRPPPTPTRGAG